MVSKAVKDVATTRAGSTFEGLKSTSGLLRYLHYCTCLIQVNSFLLIGWSISRNPARVKQVENVVAVRVHSKDRTKTGEPYYLGKMTGPLRQLKEGGKYEGNWYGRGFWVFDLTWYHYVGTGDVEGREGRQPAGDRRYVLGTAASDKCTMQLNGVVTGVDQFYKFKKVVTRKGREKLFVLEGKDHDAIVMKGNLAA